MIFEYEDLNAEPIMVGAGATSAARDAASSEVREAITPSGIQIQVVPYTGITGDDTGYGASSDTFFDPVNPYDQFVTTDESGGEFDNIGIILPKSDRRSNLDYSATNAKGYYIQYEKMNGSAAFAPPGPNKQKRTDDVYGLDNITLTSAPMNVQQYLDSDVAKKASAIITMNFKNIIPLVGGLEEAHVKLFTLLNRDITEPALAGSHSDYGNALTTTMPYPITYIKASLNKSDEAVAMYLKFNHDVTLDGSTASGYTYAAASELVQSLFDDIQQSVLSRYDVVKTTKIFNPTKEDFEFITEDEIAELSQTFTTDTSTLPEPFLAGLGFEMGDGGGSGGGTGGGSGGSSGGGGYT